MTISDLIRRALSRRRDLGFTLSDLINRALNHGLLSIEHAQEPLIPFTMLLDTNPDPRRRKLTLTRYVGEYLEEMLQAAQNSVAPSQNVSMYAIAWDGFITIDGRKWDAVLVEAGEAAAAEGVIMAQRYEVKETGLKRRNVAVGSPLEAASVPSRLWGSAGAA